MEDNPTKPTEVEKQEARERLGDDTRYCKVDGGPSYFVKMFASEEQYRPGVMVAAAEIIAKLEKGFTRENNEHLREEDGSSNFVLSPQLLQAVNKALSGKGLSKE